MEDRHDPGQRHPVDAEELETTDPRGVLPCGAAPRVVQDPGEAALAVDLHEVLEVQDTLGRVEVVLVVDGEAVGEGGEQLLRTVAGELLGPLLEVLGPGPGGLGHRGPQGLGLVGRGRIDRAPVGAPQDVVEPGQRALADVSREGRLVGLDRVLEQRLDPVPDRRRVAVSRQVHQCTDRLPVVGAADEERGLTQGLESEHLVDRLREEVSGRLEELVTREGLEQPEHLGPGVRVSAPAGRLEDSLDLGPDHRDAHDGLGVGPRGEQPDDACLTHLVAVLPADGDVLGIDGAVHGRAGGALADADPARPLADP